MRLLLYMLFMDEPFIKTYVKDAKIQERREKDLRDDFDHMINWKRVFEQIWTQIRWLQSYGQINELALRTIMKKFSNNFLAIKDNTLNQKLGAVIDSKAFKVEDGKMKEELHILSDDILKFYAACFCGGKVPQARRELDGYKDEIRPKDSK